MDSRRLVVVFSHALLVLTLVVSFFAQQKTEASQTAPQTPGVVSTGGAHAAVLDNEGRPITAGGFVDSGPIVLQDISEKAGLARWRHVMGTPEKKFILETVGSGVALLDYDNDGWLDIYVVNGSIYDALSGKAPPISGEAISDGCRLPRKSNRRTTTTPRGSLLPGYGGCTVGPETGV